MFICHYVRGGVTGCRDNNSSSATTVADTQSHVIVQIHDAPFLKSGKNVTALNITVEKVEIIDIDGNVTILSDTSQPMDILSVDANNPVILSDTSVEPGLYNQLRLILGTDNTITVDGETFPITIPSGQQSGVKLNGPFNLPAGVLFTFDLDFDAPRSVLYNKGQGYKLKPVINITSTGSVLGNFRGNLKMFSIQTSSEAVFELKDDNTYRMKFSDYPDLTLHGGDFYNSVAQELSFSVGNITQDNGDLDQEIIDYIRSLLPDIVSLSVIQWSIDSVIIVDIAGDVNTQNRVSSFSFSASYTFTDVTVDVNHNDPAMDGKFVFLQIKPEGGAPVSATGILQNGNFHRVVHVRNDYLATQNQPCQITAYLANSIEDFNVKTTVFNNEFVPNMSGASILDTTNNPWQPDSSNFTIVKNGTNNITLNFRQSMNVRFESFDFSHNNPVVAWDAYPGAVKYFVMVLVKDKVAGGHDNENDDRWDIAFSKFTTNTSEKVYSGKLNFMPVYATEGLGPSSTFLSGDVVRVEVYALDGSPWLNMAAKTGALFMDSKNYIIQ